MHRSPARILALSPLLFQAVLMQTKLVSFKVLPSIGIVLKVEVRRCDAVGVCSFSHLFSFHNVIGLIQRTLCPLNVFILLNGWICLYSVLD